MKTPPRSKHGERMPHDVPQLLLLLLGIFLLASIVLGRRLDTVTRERDRWRVMALGLGRGDHQVEYDDVPDARSDARLRDIMTKIHELSKRGAG